MSDSYRDIIEECELVDDYGGKTRPRRMKKCDSWADASIDSIAAEDEGEEESKNEADTTYSNQNPFKGLHQRRTSWDDIDILELIKKEEEEEAEQAERDQMSMDGKAISLFVSRDVYDDNDDNENDIDSSTDNPNIFLVANFDEAYMAKKFGNKTSKANQDEEEKTEIEPTTTTSSTTKKPSSLKRILNKSGTNPATTSTDRNSSKKHHAAALKGLSNRLGLMSPFKNKKKPVAIVDTAELIASA